MIERNEDGWISVNDKLPEVTKENPDHEVLTYIEEKEDTDLRMVLQAYHYEQKLFSTERCLIAKVTHWMELPEPPPQDRRKE